MRGVKTGQDFTCQQCGTSFYRAEGEIKRGRTKFCNRQCAGKAHEGENNPAFKRGWFIHYRGYKKIRVGRGYQYEHRYIVEQSLGRKLNPDEDVHHIDGDKLNNSLSNLLVLTKRDHTLLHYGMKQSSL